MTINVKDQKKDSASKTKSISDRLKIDSSAYKYSSKEKK